MRVANYRHSDGGGGGGERGCLTWIIPIQQTIGCANAGNCGCSQAGGQHPKTQEERHLSEDQ